MYLVNLCGEMHGDELRSGREEQKYCGEKIEWLEIDFFYLSDFVYINLLFLFKNKPV